MSLLLICSATMSSVRAQGTDTTPPVIESISFSPGFIDISAGAQSITVTIRVTDAQSGFKAGGVDFDSPTGNIISIGYGPLQRISGDDKDGTYRFPATFARGVEAGQWHVGSASALDNASPSNPTILFNPPTSPSTLTVVNQPGAFQFSAANYTFNEGDGRATVTVVRSDAAGTATVDYRTTDTDNFTVGCADTVNNRGGAFARCDFATAVGTVSFAPGETTKTITVPIIDDARVEGAETFQVVLTNPAGTSIGSTTVTIADNDTNANAANPVFSSPFFVRQQYLDFLSREPDQDGYNAWLRVLNNCSDVNSDPSCDRIIVSYSFFGSEEFQIKGSYVFRFYKLAFNRLPEYAEIIPDMSFVAGNTAAEVYARKAQLAANFTLRPAFQTTYSSLSNAQYVATLMGRYTLTSITTPDPQQPDGTAKVTLTGTDLTNRLNGIGGTLNRAQVFRAIADSDQVSQAEYNNTFVGMQYYGYLRRTPDESGYQAWLRVLQSGNIRGMVNGFMNSQEYRLRFGNPNQ